MKSPPRRYFWLLLWLGLGLMLLDVLSFCFPAGDPKSLRAIRVLSVVKVLKVAIKAFETEYGRHPLSEAGAIGDDLTVDSANTRLIGSLLGDDLQDNPRGIKFVDLPIARRGSGGLIGDKGSFRLRDEWGNPYQIIMDANRDEKVTNPDHINTNPKIQSNAPEWLPVRVALFSCGIDGVPHTADDMTSWRGGPGIASCRVLVVPPTMIGLIGLIFAIIGAVGIILSPRKVAAQSL